MDQEFRRWITRQFGQTVLRLRTTRGWSLQELERRSGVKHETLGKVEKGQSRPTLDTQAQLAMAFDLTLSELLADVHLTTDVSLAPTPICCQGHAALIQRFNSLARVFQSFQDAYARLLRQQHYTLEFWREIRQATQPVPQPLPVLPLPVEEPPEALVE